MGIRYEEWNLTPRPRGDRLRQCLRALRLSAITLWTAGAAATPRASAVILVGVAVAALLPSPLLAQIVVERSDTILYDIGFHGETIRDENFGGGTMFVPGAPGAGKVWDFSTIELTDPQTVVGDVYAVSEAPGPLQTEFPDADFASFTDAEEDEWGFFSEDAEGVRFHGSGMDDGTVSVRWEPSFHQVQLPLTYGKKWDDSGTRTNYTSGSPDTAPYTFENEVDAWGTITIPSETRRGGFTVPCLRLATRSELGFYTLTWWAKGCGLVASALIIGAPGDEETSLFGFSFIVDGSACTDGTPTARASWGTVKATFR